MATFNKFNQFVEDLAKKVHNLNSDTLKVMFSNVAPAATNAVKADITEIAAGNGYSAGGSIATFRYVVLYNDTPSSPLKPLIGYYDYGTAVTITSGNTFTVDVDGT